MLISTYPLEGIWSITKEAQKNFTGTINKDNLVFKIMLRQPDFITNDFYNEILEIVKKKKPNELFKKLKFEKITDGKCVQMLHLGSYDDESKTFAQMEQFAEANHLNRLSKVHLEIYLSDFQKVPIEKLKTVLRFKVKEQ